jgi:hypothetical protein
MIILAKKLSTMQGNECFSCVANRKSLCKAVMAVLRKAQAEKRLTCGLIPAIKLLEMDPDSALFCIMPQSSPGDAARHIQTVLLQAFCYENYIHIIQVHTSLDMPEKYLLRHHFFPMLDSNRLKCFPVRNTILITLNSVTEMVFVTF